MFFRHNLSFHLIPIIIFLFCINPAHSAEIILDNNQAGTVATGAWQLSSGVNSYGTQSVYSREVGATYRYTIPISEPGTYDVNLWWTEFHNRSTNVAVDITHRDGTARIYINQKQNGGQWNQVGSWYFDNDAIVTIHSDSTDNSTNADAVQLVSVISGGNGNSAPTISGVPATTVTVETAYSFIPSANDADGDDLTFNISNKPSWASFNSSTGALTGTPAMGDEGTTQNIVISVSDGLQTTSLPAFNLTVIQEDSGAVIELTLDNNQLGTVATGNWLPSGGANSYGTQSLYSRDVGATYRYTLHIDEAGTYDVNLWWTEFRSRSTNVAIDITHSDGTARVYVNQKQNGGQWNKVGSWYFTEDAIVTILSDSTDNSTNADAVRLISAVNQVPDFDLTPIFFDDMTRYASVSHLGYDDHNHDFVMDTYSETKYPITFATRIETSVWCDDRELCADDYAELIRWVDFERHVHINYSDYVVGYLSISKGIRGFARCIATSPFPNPYKGKKGAGADHQFTCSDNSVRTVRWTTPVNPDRVPGWIEVWEQIKQKGDKDHTVTSINETFYLHENGKLRAHSVAIKNSVSGIITYSTSSTMQSYED